MSGQEARPGVGPVGSQFKLGWKNQYLDEEHKLFEGRDPWAYGLKANLAALTKFLSYCDAQGISAKPITPYDLFVPSTWELSE